MRIPTDEGEGESALVNLTPLIDVVFLLLIFFMVTATFQNDERDLAISVPQASKGNPITDLPEVLIVGVRRDGSLSISDRVLNRDQLRLVLQRAKRKNPSQKVIVRGDKAVPFQYPVSVLDLCASLDIETSFSTTVRGDN